MTYLVGKNALESTKCAFAVQWFEAVGGINVTELVDGLLQVVSNHRSGLLIVTPERVDLAEVAGTTSRRTPVSVNFLDEAT